jgi:hypothetical protein
MLYQSDDLVLAHAKQRRQQLQDEAQAHRQARCLRAARTAGVSAASHVAARRPTLADRLLHTAGAQLVRWGTRLQQRSATRQVASANFVDTRPA